MVYIQSVSVVEWAVSFVRIRGWNGAIVGVGVHADGTR
jgi:hypothetical protein